MSLENLSETQPLKYLTLEDIKKLPQTMPGAFCVLEENRVCVRFKITREFREDETLAHHPQITASDGVQLISLILSKTNGWHLQSHNGDFDFNRRVLRYLNCGQLTIIQDITAVLGEDFEN